MLGVSAKDMCENENNRCSTTGIFAGVGQTKLRGSISKNHTGTSYEEDNEDDRVR